MKTPAFSGKNTPEPGSSLRRDTQESRLFSGKNIPEPGSSLRRDAFASHHFLRAGFLLSLLVLWQILSLWIGKPFLLPSPLDVGASLWKNRTVLFTVHLPATLRVVAAGGVLSVLLGILFAVAMDWSSWLMRALYPILTVSQTIPVMCIAPVLVLWFGYTDRMRIVVVVLVNFFTVTVSLCDGFASTSPQRTELLQTYGASRLQTFLLLRVPTALPYFFTALHVTVPWSVIGAAVAEWLGAPAGLGTYSRTCMMSLDAAGLLAPLVVLTAAALVLNVLLGRIETWVLAWRDARHIPLLFRKGKKQDNKV